MIVANDLAIFHLTVSHDRVWKENWLFFFLMQAIGPKHI